MRSYRCHGYPIKLARGDRCSLAPLLPHYGIKKSERRMSQVDWPPDLVRKGNSAFMSPGAHKYLWVLNWVCARERNIKRGKERERQITGEGRERKKRPEFYYSYIYRVHNEARHLSVLSFTLLSCQLYVKYQWPHTHWNVLFVINTFKCANESKIYSHSRSYL